MRERWVKDRSWKVYFPVGNKGLGLYFQHKEQAMGEGERELIKWGKDLGSHLCFQKLSSWVLREGLWVREKGTSWSYLSGGQM